MKEINIRLATLVLLLSWWAPRGFGQTAQVLGHVTDPSGAVVPGAQITVTNLDTGFERRTVSSGTGDYVLPLLPLGRYRLSVQAKGFAPVVRSGIQLMVNQTLTQDVTLSIGQVSQQIEVTASAQLIQSASTELGTVVTREAVNDLPLNGRNFTQLLSLTPGATPISTGQSANLGADDGSTVAIPGSRFTLPSLNGQQNRTMVFFLDGIFNTDFRTTTYTLLPIIDTVREFKVQTHNDDAQYGQVLGGVINVITKSGTNDLHGSAWEFVRNNVFDARNPITETNRSSASPYHLNQFGAAVGGPVYLPKLYNGKNKTFFYFGYEGWRYSRPSQSLYNVPTAAELNGDFSQSTLDQPIYDPATTRPDPNNPGQYIRDPFLNNIIPPDRLDNDASRAVINYIQNYFDKPNLVGNPFFNAVNTAPVINNNNTYSIRADENWGSKDTFWFRYTQMNVRQENPATRSVINSQVMHAKNTGGGWTHIFTPTLLMDVRGGYTSRPFLIGTLPKAGLGPIEQAGFAYSTLFPNISLAAPWGSSGLAQPQPRGNPNYSISPSLTWIRTAHTWNFGFQWVSQARSQSGSGESFTFNNVPTAHPQQLGTTGNSLASAVLGLPSQSSANLINAIEYKIPSWGVYAQDKWKITPRLTLNLGLRYDHSNKTSLIKGMQNKFDFNTGNWLIGAKTLPPPCNTAGVAPCIPGDGTLASIPYGDHILVDPSIMEGPTPQWNDFGPRIGLAYRLTDNTIVRVGYGLFWDTLSGYSQSISSSMNSWPFIGAVSNPLNAVGTPPVTILQADKTIGSPLPGPAPWHNITWYIDPHWRNPLSHQWNAEIQRTFGENLLLSVAYVGSTNRDIDYGGLANTAPTPRGTAPYPYMGSIFWDYSGASSNYHALQAKLQHNFANGLQFLASYTWSKSIDNSSGLYGAENGAGGSQIQNYYDRQSNRAVSSYNIPQLFSFSGLYELPAGRGHSRLNSGPASWVLGNWQVNTIATLRSGVPYTLSVVGDVANISNSVAWWNYERPNLVGNPNLASPTAQQYFNTSAFAVPATGSFGNVGRNTLRSASVYVVDFSLFKNFPLGKDTARQLQFRVEGFNIFNIQSLGVPGTTIGQPTTGVVGNVAAPPRELQLALKLNF